jgi:hypothetical protein
MGHLLSVPFVTEEEMQNPSDSGASAELDIVLEPELPDLTTQDVTPLTMSQVYANARANTKVFQFNDDVMLGILYNLFGHDFTHDYAGNMNERLDGIVNVLAQLNTLLDIQPQLSQGGGSFQEGGNHWDYTAYKFDKPKTNLDGTPNLENLLKIETDTDSQVFTKTRVKLIITNINSKIKFVEEEGPPAARTRSRTNAIKLIYNNIEEYLDEFRMYLLFDFSDDMIEALSKKRKKNSSPRKSKRVALTKTGGSRRRKNKTTRRTKNFASSAQNFHTITESIKNVLLQNFIITKKTHLNLSKLYYISYLVYSYFDKNTKIHPIDRFNSNAFINILTLLFFKNVFIENDFTKITNMVYDVIDVIDESEEHHKYHRGTTTTLSSQNTVSSQNKERPQPIETAPILNAEQQKPYSDSGIILSPIRTKKYDESEPFHQDSGIVLTSSSPNLIIQKGGVLEESDFEKYNDIFNFFSKKLFNNFSEDDISDLKTKLPKYRINKDYIIRYFDNFVALMKDTKVSKNKKKLIAAIDVYNNGIDYYIKILKPPRLESINNTMNRHKENVLASLKLFFYDTYAEFRQKEFKETMLKQVQSIKAKEREKSREKALKKAQEVQDRASHGDASASPVPRYVCQLIVKGLLAYFKYDELSEEQQKQHFLKKQHKILEDISIGKNITTIDKNLIGFVRGYYTEPQNIVKEGISGLVIKGEKCIKELKSIVKQKTTKIINNSSDLNAIDINKSDFPNKLLCPPSSILDGMATCSHDKAKTKDHNIVEDSMYFRLESESYFYNGYSHLKPDGDTIVIGFQSGLIGVENGSFSTFKETQLSKSNTLMASVVFKNVCDALCVKYRVLSTGEFGHDKAKVYRELLLNSYDFSDIVKLSAMKNIGDFFQQINMIAKNGGFARPDVPQFAESNTIIGTNNDRPAAVIGMIMAMHTLNRDVIRKNLLIGYLHGENSVFYKRNAGVAAAAASSKKKGGSKRVKKHTRKKIKN